MRSVLFVLPLVLVCGLARADGMEPMPAGEQADARMTEEGPDRAMKSPRRGDGKARRLPRGDLRHCLELKDNAAIIRCAETRPKK